MNQQEIRDFNNQTYTVEEGANLIKELNDRTKHDEDGYNSIAELGEKVKKLFGLTTEINGQLVRFIKHPQNNNPANAEVFEPYDYGFEYMRDNTIIWTLAQWTGGDQSDDANWIVHTYIRIEPIP
ncbi:hypothetical protein [Winogradskyella luteola]|uniref:Uncharacterized protein n=1 Tax=Winogradskyella luteola TaxID=2828330 RepID=A0A9X1F6Y2_9FLAO|nr:hypothetical protein [Winogradskyella luteola]MBV7268364.1 hypothetical protein [Winogradskyella luteola]